MRELTVRIRYTRPALGNIKVRHRNGRFVLPRDRATGQVMFLPTWHSSNMKFAAKLLGKYQDVVSQILWDITIDGVVRRDNYKRYYQQGQHRRHVLHEAFFADQVVGINCVVPASIPDADFWDLMRVAGQYKGLSPFRPGEFGLFTVESLRSRRISVEQALPHQGEEKQKAAGVGSSYGLPDEQ